MSSEISGINFCKASRLLCEASLYAACWSPQPLPAKETRSRGFLGGQCGAGASSAVVARCQIVQSDQCNFNLHKAHQYLLHIAGAMRSMLNFDMKSRHRESTIGLDRKVSSTFRSLFHWQRMASESKRGTVFDDDDTESSHTGSHVPTASLNNRGRQRCW